MSRRKAASFPTLLWDLLSFPKDPPRRRPSTTTTRPAPPRQRVSRKQQQYDELVRTMKKRYGIRINRWRSSTTGCAWQVEYHNGSISRLIEAPYPRGPVSAAVFLHEIGHHAIGFYRYKPRCYEEYKAWMWSLQAMRDNDINITPRVEKLVDSCLRYAVAKARRRRIKRLPVELVKYL
ncbi:hypothetical protein HED60_24485 [Planctomycetales bacterium ZRK34]|nr:hypothetical protein HED60_24485 [Planctomycetales bacterium ZRK34]